MYTEHPSCVTPPDTTVLWRYMNHDRFLDLIQARQLYFSRLNQFQDKLEGAHYEHLKSRIRLLSPEYQEKINYFYKWQAGYMLFNCWHENDRESATMWNVYTSKDNGVAIRSTVARIKSALSAEVRDIHIGRMNYLDYSDEANLPMNADIQHFNMIEPLWCKHPNFRHEQEVRLMMGGRESKILMAATTQLNPNLGDEALFLGNPNTQRIRVELNQLVEAVILSPKFPKCEMRGIIEAASSCGLQCEILCSSLRA